MGFYSAPISDAEYVNRVRRHPPSSLVPLLARIAATRWKPGSWLDVPAGASFIERAAAHRLTPWALADIARVSLVASNKHRTTTTATENDLLECADAYFWQKDPELGRGGPDARTRFMWRKASEQLSHEQSWFNELARSSAIFEHTPPTKPLKVITPGWTDILFGCNVSQHVGIGFMVHAIGVRHEGRFSPQWFADPIHKPITDRIPPEVMRRVLDEHFVTDVATFKAANGQIRASQYRRFSYNPLLERPLVSGLSDQHLLPIPAQVMHKISPLGIYYAGVAVPDWGNKFAEDIGELFEQYVGRQLGTRTDIAIHAEISYDRDNKRSVDWIAVGEETVILVEVKSARQSENMRLGIPEADTDITRMLSRAYGQIATTERLINEGHQAFSAIPPGLPRFGLIATMEPFYIANVEPIRNLHPTLPTIPVRVCSSEELERLVTLTDVSVDAFLKEFMADVTKEDWRIRAGLGEHAHSRNTVLDQAWRSYDWGTGALPDAPGAATLPVP